MRVPTFVVVAVIAAAAAYEVARNVYRMLKD